MQSGEPSQEEQGAGLGARGASATSAFPDVPKQLPPLAPHTIPTRGPKGSWRETGSGVRDFLPLVGTLKALLTITSLTTLILLNEE